MSKVCESCGNASCSCHPKVPELNAALAAAQQRIAELEVYKATAEELVNSRVIMFRQFQSQIDEAHAQAERYRAALRHYCVHKNGCLIIPCMCGLAEALNAATPPPGREFDLIEYRNAAQGLLNHFGRYSKDHRCEIVTDMERIVAALDAAQAALEEK